MNTVALQTSSEWKYDPTSKYVKSEVDHQKPVEGLTIFEFTGAKREKPFEITLADGWKTIDKGNWVMHVPPSFPVGMDIYEMGTYSPEENMSLTFSLIALSADEAALLASGDAEMPEIDPTLGDSLDLDTAWGGIHYLLTGSSDVSEDAARPEDFLLSGARLEFSEHVAVHTADEVAQFAAVLKDTSAEQWAQRFDAEEMNRLDVYGGPWDISGKAYLTESLAGLLEFVNAAAEENQGMMVLMY